MANARSDRRRSSSSGSSRTSGARRKSRPSSEQRRPLQGRDTGYRIGSNRRQKPKGNVNPRLIVVGIVGILLLIAIVFGITSCVKGCNSSRPKGKDDAKVAKVNPVDERVAYGVSADETSKLSTILDRNEAFEKIAKNANKISDARLIDLAVTEPEAIDFVAGALDSDGSTQPYADAVVTGDYPTLYTFDGRWGYASYGEGTVGSLGSGPVALSMASMGLSGKATYDPSTIAQAVVAAKLDSGTTGMDDAFVTNHAAEAGVTATSVEASSDGMYNPIVEGQPVLIKLKSDSGVGSSSAHWALITGLNSDNSVNLHDPTSVSTSTRPWSLGALSSRSDTAYALTAGAAVTPAAGTDDAATTDQATTDGQTAEGEGDGEY